MKSFKFLSNDDDEMEEYLNDSSPSWMWGEEFHMSPVRDYDWRMNVTVSNGIRDFLSRFPDYFIVPVHSITGNGIRHSFGNRNDGMGWGFDITSELLTIEYFTLIPRDETV
jgi:hypothetical protein